LQINGQEAKETKVLGCVTERPQRQPNRFAMAASERDLESCVHIIFLGRERVIVPMWPLNGPVDNWQDQPYHRKSDSTERITG
jgi:hypothetical protein